MKIVRGIVLLFSVCLNSCLSPLEDNRATELVQLHYKQMNADPSAGKWYVQQVYIGNIVQAEKDTFIVTGRSGGLYAPPVMMEGVASFTRPFSDSFAFRAYPMGKVWIAKGWKNLGLYR